MRRSVTSPACPAADPHPAQVGRAPLAVAPSSCRCYAHGHRFVLAPCLGFCSTCVTSTRPRKHVRWQPSWQAAGDAVESPLLSHVILQSPCGSGTTRTRAMRRRRRKLNGRMTQMRRRMQRTMQRMQARMRRMQRLPQVHPQHTATSPQTYVLTKGTTCVCLHGHPLDHRAQNNGAIKHACFAAEPGSQPGRSFGGGGWGSNFGGLGGTDVPLPQVLGSCSMLPGVMVQALHHVHHLLARS
jgi:hypothetical protein